MRWSVMSYPQAGSRKKNAGSLEISSLIEQTHTQPYNIHMQYKQKKYKLNIKMLNYGFTSGLSQRTLLRKWKDILENGRKYMQILCLLRDLYLRYIKNVWVSDEKEITVGSEQKI